MTAYFMSHVLLEQALTLQVWSFSCLKTVVFTSLISHADVMQPYLTPFNFVFNCAHILGVSSCNQSLILCTKRMSQLARPDYIHDLYHVL